MNTSVDLMETVDHGMQPAEEAARTAVRAGSREFRNLIADVEDLIKRVAHVDDTDLARARLYLAAAVRIALRNGLELLGVSAPDKM